MKVFPHFTLVAAVMCGCAGRPPQRPIPRLTGEIPPSTRGRLDGVFSSVDEAAAAACAWLWLHVPEAKRFEYAGCLYRTPEGIYAGLPETKRDLGFCVPPRPPAGAALVGDYHGHTTRVTFSPSDLNTKQKTPLYLCAPDGSVLKHDPQSGLTKELSR